MNIEFRRSFEKDLQKILDADLLTRVQEIIEEFENAESLTEIRNIKKLKGEEEYYRIRVVDYRLGIKVNDGIVSFVRILHRKEIYRYFP